MVTSIPAAASRSATGTGLIATARPLAPAPPTDSSKRRSGPLRADPGPPSSGPPNVFFRAFNAGLDALNRVYTAGVRLTLKGAPIGLLIIGAVAVDQWIRKVAA